MAVPILRGDFNTQIRSKSLPVVIEFFAVWCPKCSMMTPVYERVAKDLSGQFLFYRVDIDISEEEIKDLGIEIVPTFVVYQKGVILGFTSGVLSQSVLKARILSLI